MSLYAFIVGMCAALALTQSLAFWRAQRECGIVLNHERRRAARSPK